MSRKLVSEDPWTDEAGVQHVVVYLVDPEDDGKVMVQVILSFTPDPEQAPLAHGLQAKEWAAKGDVAMLVQGVRAILKDKGYKDIMIHSHENPRTDDSWYIRAGAKHSVTFWLLPTGKD